MATKAATLTATELAEKFGTDARTVRKFIRDEVGKVGKGNRHQIDSKSVTILRKKFTAWNENREAAAAAKAEAVLPEGNELTEPVTTEQAKAEKPKKAPKPKVTKLAPSGATKAKIEEAKQ